MKAIWKALQHIPALRTVGQDSEEWENELNPNKREILQKSYIFLAESNVTQEEMEEGVRCIGHNAYVGGFEAAVCAAKYIPHMIALVQRHELPISLRRRVLMSLSEICHRCREAQKRVRYHGFLHTLSELVGATDDPQTVRWACYLLYICMADNIPFIRDVLAIPGLKEKLERVAALPWNWEGWPGNLPALLLMIMGLRMV